VSGTKSLPRGRAAGAPAAPAASSRPSEPPALLVWTCLAIIYVVWGSTYLAIRIMVETMPPLLGAGVRFVLAGAALLAFLAVRRGWSALRPTRRQLVGALAIGTLLTGANAVVTLAEVDVPSGLAALLIAAVPLIVIVLRRGSGERVARASAAGVAVGFIGVAILLLPGERPDGATLIGMLGIIGGAVMWAAGSFASPRTDLPADPFTSTGWQMLLGGLVCSLAGVIHGELPDVHPASFSTDSILAFAYLVTIGSILAFSAYIWLLQNVAVSKVATYAYVNPVIAIFLGWLVLDETISAVTLAGAAVIVTSIAVVVRVESRRRAVE
jgi:drug/metabolite transporter (DMT)-like permease